MQEQVREISHFFSRYSVAAVDDETRIVRAAGQAYLVKNIRLDEQLDVQTVVETLQQHQTLSSQYLLSLQHYELVSQQQGIIRVIYAYGLMSLDQEIVERQHSETHFGSSEIWAMVYSITRALEYLSKLNIGYGVLGCDKIFIDSGKIRLLDPSAIAEDPLAIVQNRLYSPEILNGHDEVDILKSDVYVFGLCILEVALLVNLAHDSRGRYDEGRGRYDATRINIYLEKMEGLYEMELCNLVRQMLHFLPDQRPSFENIRDYLEKTLEMAGQVNEDYYTPLPADAEDMPNEHISNEFTSQCEYVDMEEEEESEQPSGSLSDYDRARSKYLGESHHVLQSRTEENTLTNSFILQTSRALPTEKKRVAKSIKEKIVKQISAADLEIVEVVSQPRREEVFRPTNHDSLFTDPKILEMIQKDLKSIARNRSQHYYRNKENDVQSNF